MKLIVALLLALAVLGCSGAAHSVVAPPVVSEPPDVPTEPPGLPDEPQEPPETCDDGSEPPCEAPPADDPPADDPEPPGTGPGPGTGQGPTGPSEPEPLQPDPPEPPAVDPPTTPDPPDDPPAVDPPVMEPETGLPVIEACSGSDGILMVRNRVNPWVLHPCDEGNCDPFNADTSYDLPVEPGAYVFRVPAADRDRDVMIRASTTHEPGDWHLDVPAPGGQNLARVQERSDLVSRMDVAIPGGQESCFTFNYTDARTPNENTQDPTDYYDGPYITFRVRVEYILEG